MVALTLPEDRIARVDGTLPASTNASSTTPRRAADCGHRVNTSNGMAAAIAW